MVQTRDGAGGRLAAGGAGAALRLWTRRAGAAVRSQHQLGVAAAGAGGASPGSDPAAGARGQDRGAAGDEVSGSGGAHQPGGLPADGGGVRQPSLEHAASRATLCRLARGLADDAKTHSRSARAVFESAAASGTDRLGHRTVARSGDGVGHREARQPAVDRRSGPTGRQPTGRGATPHRSYPEPTPAP